jgi:trk system potassium uptake protein TrkA
MKRRSFAVIGLGRFGEGMATTLTSLGHDVLGIDSDQEKVDRLADSVTQTLRLDATDEKALRGAGVAEVDVAVISIGENIEASLLVVMLVRELGVGTIVAKAITPLHGRILEKIGASRVVFPEREMAVRVAHSLVVPNVLDFIELSRDYSIMEVPAPATFVGKSVKELEIRPRYGLTLIAIEREGPTGTDATVSPSADERVREGDILALLGPNDRLNDIRKLIG